MHLVWKRSDLLTKRCVRESGAYELYKVKISFYSTYIEKKKSDYAINMHEHLCGLWRNW